jgi:hypothetical protein
MNNVRRKLGYFAAFFALWTLVALIFVSLSVGDGVRGRKSAEFALLFLIQFTRFYLWGLFSPLIYRFVRRFPIEIRAFRWRNLLIHLAGMTVFCTVHQLLLMVIRWMVNARRERRFLRFLKIFSAIFSMASISAWLFIR